MPETWKEKIGWQFFKHVLTFKSYKPRITQLLSDSSNKNIIIFKNRREVRDYLQFLKTAKNRN